MKGFNLEKKTNADNINFKWQKRDLTPTIHDFDDTNSGCQMENITENSSPSEIFECFINHDIVQEIVTQSNIF